jgi:hypothetical protein
VIEDLRKTKNMTPDSKLKVALATQITKEKELELQLSQQEREWF